MKTNKEYYDEIYQAKYEYYEKYLDIVVLFTSLLSVGYYFSDCQIFGYFQSETIIPRFFVLYLTIAYFLCKKFSKNYKIIINMAYFVFHGIMIGTIGACAYLPSLEYACVGFFILQFIFVTIDVAAPFNLTFFWQALLFIDITIANTFLHYPDYTQMIMLGIPLFLGTCAFSIAMDKTYRDQYEIRKNLEYTLEHDPLTDAYNRHIFTKIADENNTLKIVSSLFILIGDIDHFKNINDTFGHKRGDEVLKETAKVIKSLIKEDDYFVRWGGEEFVVLTNDTKEKAISLADKINKEISNHFNHKITISIGITNYDGGDYQDNIKRADEALYTAKNTGRNKYVTNFKPL